MNKLPLSLLVLSLTACHSGDGANGGSRVVDKPAKLEFFVMSQCPYGVQVMNAVAPVLDQLGQNVEFSVNYIGQQQGDTFTSLHGEGEVQGDIVQLCAAKQAPTKYMQMITCQNKNPHEVNSNWQACAKEAGIDVGALTTCFKGDEGKKLLANSFALAKSRGAEGSPTMFLDGQAYQGGRKSRDFLKAICNTYGAGPQPASCKNIPVAPKVVTTFFSDSRCAECNIDKLAGRLKSDVAGAEIKMVDYMSPEGKKLYDDIKAKDPSFRFLPVILLDKALKSDTEGMQAIQRYVKPLGEDFMLALNGQFDPTAEICDNNNVDDDGNGKADCSDDACKGALNCRAEKVKTLDAFVMSHCPYGAKAMTAMKEVMGAFGKDMSFNVHFIGDPNRLSSMHGTDEVDEDVRQVCAIKHYGKNEKFMEYVGCRAADYKNADWKACTGKNGIDPAVLEACFNGEGKDLLKKDFVLSASLNMDSSPTFLANNRYTFNGVDAETIKQSYCKYNSSLDGCKKTLSADGQVQGSCGN